MSDFWINKYTDYIDINCTIDNCTMCPIFSFSFGTYSYSFKIPRIDIEDNCGKFLEMTGVLDQILRDEKLKELGIK